VTRVERDLPCLACGVEGREGRDVMFKVVEVPEEERRVVSVVLPEFAVADSLQMPVEVRERYVTEPRCRDEAACRRRVLAHLATLSETGEALPVPAPAGAGSSAASPVPEAPPAPAEPEEPEEPEAPPFVPVEPEPEYEL
jgi:hypothetical protein